MSRWTLPAKIWKFLPQSILFSKEIVTVQFSNGSFCIFFKQKELSENTNNLNMISLNDEDFLNLENNLKSSSRRQNENIEDIQIPIIEFSFNKSLKKIISRKNSENLIYFWSVCDLIFEFSINSNRITKIISIRNIIKEFNQDFLKLKIKAVDFNSQRKEIYVGDSQGNILVFNTSNFNSR